MLSLWSSARCSRNIPQMGECPGSIPPCSDWRLWWLGQAKLQSDEASVLEVAKVSKTATAQKSMAPLEALLRA